MKIRFRPRFSLRTLMIAMTLGTIFCWSLVWFEGTWMTGQKGFKAYRVHCWKLSAGVVNVNNDGEGWRVGLWCEERVRRFDSPDYPLVTLPIGGDD